MTNHIILPRDWVDSFLVSLCLPSDSSIKLDLVTYGDKDGSDDVRRYTDFRKLICEADPNVKLPFIEETRHLSLPDINSLTPGCNTLLPESYQLAESFFSDSKIEDGDSIIILADSQLWIGVAFHLLSSNRQFRNLSLLIPYDENHEETMVNLLLLKNYLESRLKIEIVDFGKNNDLALCSLAVAGCSIPFSPGIFLRKLPNKSIYVTANELPSNTTAISLNNLKQLQFNLESALKNPTFLKKSKTERSFSDFLYPIDSFLNLTDKILLSRKLTFRFEAAPSDCSGKINKVKSQPDGKSSNFYCLNALAHILPLSLVSSPLFLSQDTERPEINNIENINVDENFNFSLLINPFVCSQITFNAFKNREGESSAKIRSACLDLWEISMENLIENVETSIKVTELTRKENSKTWKLYSSLPYSEIPLNQKAIFNVAFSKGISGFTSPETGFAVCYISGVNVKELKERSLEFKRFIYSYVNLLDGFSPEFKGYVSDNCETDEIADSTGNFFQSYPPLRKHIPIY
ncbi:MAG: hypothetical protein J1F38_00680 [Muribaculaceae bacterium]|nr:hypothetical protein [Muribaculaceae bacterium]